MQDYVVHIFAHVRVPVLVTATDQEDAVRKAIEEFSDNYKSYLSRPDNFEYAEDFEQDVMVDEVGDMEYEKSMWWKALPDGTIMLSKYYEEGKTYTIEEEK